MAPYSVAYGNDVYVKVKAINAYGSSDESDAGNGAKIIKSPDAPVNLQENYSLR